MALPGVLRAAPATPPGDLGNARRFVLAVGVNRGLSTETPLQYAEADAQMFIDVMQDVGGATARNTVSLLDISAGDLEDELDRVAGRLQREQWGPEDLLAIYVSSHAAQGNLHLNGTQLPMRALRDFVFNAPVGIAILVLDTCSAGDVARTKGLAAIQGPVVELETPPVAGRVILASSGPTEYAHESSSVGGSYFTHHLVAGLRGAADVSGDRLVSLQEAFAYAYTRTIEATTASRGGRQTPRYELELSGERDLVLTSLGRGRAWLSIDVERPGDWLVTSVERGRVVAHVVKGKGSVVLSIDPGSYRLRTREGDSYLDGTVEVTEGESQRIDESDLNRWSLIAGRAKGGAQSDAMSWQLAVGGQMGTPAVEGLDSLITGIFVLARAVASDGWLGARRFYELTIGYRGGHSIERQGFTEQEIDGAGALGLRWGPERWGLRVGVLAGALMIRQQQLPDELADADTRTGLQPRFGALTGLDFGLSDSLAVELDGIFGIQRLRKQTGTRASPYVTGLLGLAVRF